MKKLFFFLLVFGNITLPRQAFAQGDSTFVVFEFESFMEQVKQHHPLAKQAENQVLIGEAYLQKAKGSFDPKLEGSADQKYYDEKQYYSILNAGLKIPTWYGVSFQGGYDLNNGDFLNPEQNVPNDGLWYAGVNVALGRGLIIDQRRAEFMKAQIYRNSSIQNRIIMLNGLYFDAASAYWEWFKAYSKMQVYEDAIINAQERYNNVVQNVLLGSDPGIDSVEANTQLQTRFYSYLEARLDYLNSTSLLEIYLWNDGFIPLELDSTKVPPVLNNIPNSRIDPALLMKIDSLKMMHPQLLKTQYEVEQQAVDLKLSRENIKPVINLKYNALTEADGPEGAFYYSMNNYKWGADVQIPIFLRKERGQLKLDRLELENLQSGLAFKQEQIEFKIESAYNEWTITNQQLGIWRQATQDYLTLLESEQTMYTIGESSLFMVNSREKAYIDAQLKLVETILKNQKAAVKTKYAMGVLINE
ncbi:TolC family protein [Crocinitomix sp.]|nr:TolC family protein [Crocinitomix sp.]